MRGCVRVLVLLCGLTIPAWSAESWSRYSGPWGADVRALEGAPDGSVYLGVGSHDAHDTYGTGGGLFESRDGGLTWSRTGLQGWPVAEVGSVGDQIFVATFGNGVWHRTGDGAWAPLSAGLNDLKARCIFAGDGLLLGTTTGFFYLDSTNSWQPGAASGPTGGVWAIAQSPWDPATFLAATDSAVWKTIDGGLNWFPSGVGIMQKAIRSLAIGSDGRCWAGSFDRWNGYGHLYVSTDSGATWTIAYEPGSHDAVWAIAVSPDDPDLIVIGTGCLASGRASLFRSDDGGGRWDQVYCSPIFGSDRSIRAIEFLTPAEILAGCESSTGVLRSTDAGLTWTPHAEGLDAANVYAITRAGPNLVVGRGFSSSVARSPDGGQTWESLDPVFPSLFVRALAAWPGNPARILAAAWNAGYCTSDGGQTWQSQPVGTHGEAATVSPADSNLVYYASGSGLYVSRDGCQTWEGPHPALGGGARAVATHPQDADRAFASASNYLFGTDDAGATWDTLGLYDCRAIVFHPGDERFIYLGTASDGVYVSQDGGETFEWIGLGMPDWAVTSLAVGPEDPSIIWAGTPTGVYKTLDLGTTWVPDNAGLQNLHVLSLHVDAPAGLIRVGAYGGGLAWSPIDHTGVKAIPQSDRTLVLSVTPVPTTGLVTVRALPCHDLARHDLDLSLYALDGRLVRRERFAGSHACVWDLTGIPAASYVLQGASDGRVGRAVVVVTR